MSTRSFVFMDLTIGRAIPWTELETLIRAVPLKAKDPQGQPIHPYANARISLREVTPEELNASSFYLIERNIAFQRELHKHLFALGYDTLHLTGALELHTPTNELWRLLPPVVEVMHEEITHRNTRGDIDYLALPTSITLPIVNDGMHRVWLARELGQTINVIHISGIPTEHPYYALPNSWDQVKIFTDTPKTMAGKKYYRRQKSYDLYRDFDVLGCGKPRNTGTGDIAKPT